MVADPELMSYRELQQMCKANGLSATGKTTELRESLEAFLRSNGAGVEAPAGNELAYSNSGGKGDSGYRSGDDDGGGGTGARDMRGDEDAYGNVGRRGRREFGGDEDAYGNVGRRGRRDFGGDEDAYGNGGGRGGYAGSMGARERRDVRRQEQGANVKPGDWTCPNCGASVFASKTRCYKCGTINPDPDARAAAAARSSGRGTPPWHPDSAGKRRDAPGGASWAWQGLEGDESFEVSLEDDEAAFREAFGPARSSGIDFGDKGKDIPVEVELPRKLRNELPPEMAPVAHFDDLACGRVLRRNLRFAGFAQPTPVQSHSMPVALGGLDVISVAQTGSGKTLAFMLPILKRLLEVRTPVRVARDEPSGDGGGGRGRGGGGYERSGRGGGGAYGGRGSRVRTRGYGEPVAIRALVLAPTRELAQQIAAESEKFAFRTGLRIGIAYGGTPFGSQMRELERGCDVLIGTPGRVNDMVSRERVSLRNVEVLVLDEADRMLDMGFEPQIRSLVEEADMPSSGREGGARSSKGRGRVEEDGFGDDDDGDEAVGGGVSSGRQTLMFSATFPKAVRTIADSFLVDPLMLKVGRVGGAATSVTQRVIRVEGRDKTDKTAELLREVPGKTIVFVNTKREADNLEYDLNALGHPSASVHGDKDQRERERALGDFKAGRIEVIIGTDVLGRGIDVPEVTHVINYDAPDEIEDYTHRIGRTGRAGHLGIATTMITGANRNLARELTQMLAASKQEVPEWLADMVPNRGGGGGRRGGGRGRGGGGGGGGDRGRARRFGGDGDGGGGRGGGGGYSPYGGGGRAARGGY